MKIVVCTWIDNIYSFSSKLSGSIAILEDFERYLGSRWGLVIKKSSRACMTCRGNIDTPIDPLKWPKQNHLNILGHIIQYDGGLREDWGNTKTSLWRRYWQTCGSKAYKKLGPIEKAKLLELSVVSSFRWKLSRWPFQKTIAVELDALQCNMFARLISCPKADGESVDHYCRRRMRIARNACQQSGFWSRLWCQRVVNWDDHVKRAGQYKHMCFYLLNYHDSEWLQMQRSRFVPSNGSDQTRNSIFRGRTGTRLNIGRPQVRWADGLSVARLLLEGRQSSLDGNNALSVGSAIREAITIARNYVEMFNPFS